MSKIRSVFASVAPATRLKGFVLFSNKPEKSPNSEETKLVGTSMDFFSLDEAIEGGENLRDNGFSWYQILDRRQGRIVYEFLTPPPAVYKSTGWDFLPREKEIRRSL